MVLVTTCMAVLVTPALAKLPIAQQSPCHGSTARLGVLLQTRCQHWANWGSLSAA